MPLSKKRDRDRKQVERAKIRLDKQLSSPAGANHVQPKPSVEDILIARDYLDNAAVPTEDRKLEPNTWGVVKFAGIND